MPRDFRFPTDGEPSVARESLAATIGHDPEVKLHELRKAGERKAHAEGVAYQMIEMRKVVLARIAGQIAEVHAKESIAEAKLDRMARAHPDYAKHIEGTAAAIEEKGLAVAGYERLEAELKWMESTAIHAMSMAKLQR